MSTREGVEGLVEFMSKVADSEELQAKIGEEIEVGELMALGAECGYDFNCHAVTEYAEREVPKVGIDVTFSYMHDVLYI